MLYRYAWYHLCVVSLSYIYTHSFELDLFPSTYYSQLFTMEYSRGEYKNKRGNVYTTTDGYKYTLSKERKSVAYLKCVLFREKCPSTAKLEMSINIITVICPHNHGIGNYHAEKFKLRTKCKIAAKSLHPN